MSEHSKTPWELRGSATLRCADGDYIATLENNTARAANAAFIVKAVNSFSVLVEIAEQHEKTILYYIRKDKACGDDEGVRMKTASLNTVRAALAKARGER